MSLRVETTIDAPPDVVWTHLEDIASHTAWMADAVAIEFLSDRRQGEGTRFACRTRVGFLSTTDLMEITEWSPPRVMGVRHAGAVSGEGRFELHPAADPGDPGDSGDPAADSGDPAADSGDPAADPGDPAADPGDSAADSTTMTWVEQLRFPWWFGGPLGATLARPVLRRIWQGNLNRLKDLVEAAPGHGS